MSQSYRAARALLSALAILASAACAPPQDQVGQAAPQAKIQHLGALFANSYRDPARWLCHPGLPTASNVCLNNVANLSVQADGSTQGYSALTPPDQQHAQVDCFYVYPTTSIDPTPNSDFLVDAQETMIVEAQAALYATTCRMYAPIYRQRTLPLLAVNVALGYFPPGFELPVDISGSADALAYQDVRDAFHSYLQYSNQGRGFVLIGHSQGATLLKQLIVDEIETDPVLSARMIAAHLLGTPVEVPIGGDVGGTFQHTAACRDPAQTGCVVSYSTFRSGDPELATPRYGRSTTPGMQQLCTNPAALGGGEAELGARLPFYQPPALQLLLKPRGSGGPYANRLTSLGASFSYRYFSVPGQILGHCYNDADGYGYLSVSIDADSSDPRADDYPGEFFGGTGWGLHMLDVSIAQEDLVALARSQIDAWLASR